MKKLITAAAVAAWISCGIYGWWLDEGTLQRQYKSVYQTASYWDSDRVAGICGQDRTILIPAVLGGPVWAFFAGLDAGRFDQGTFRCPDPRFVGAVEEAQQ